MTSAFNTLSLCNIESTCNCFLNSGNSFPLLPDCLLVLSAGTFCYVSGFPSEKKTCPIPNHQLKSFYGNNNNTTEESSGTFLSQTLNLILSCHSSKNLLLHLILLLIANIFYLLPEKC